MLRHGTALPCLASLLLATAGLITPTAYAGQDVGWTRPLAEEGVDGALRSLPYPRSWTLHRVSSYDRTGGADDAQYGQQVYDGGVVLADLKGPGCITRLYAENPWGTLLVYVDDMQHPIIARQFKEIFSGALELFSPSFALFAPPFTGEASGGYYSYVPIPYAERCRIIVMGEGESLNYQVDYARFPDGTPIKSFQLKLSKEDVEYFRAWRDDWLDYDLKMHDLKTEELHQSSTILHPGTDWLVYCIEGPGVITELEMFLGSVDAEYTDSIWIEAYFDHQKEPGILAPIGDFFGRTSTAHDDYSGVVVGTLDNRMWCRYPMPFREYAEIRVLNTGKQSADFKYNIIWRPGPVQNQHYFFARYNSATTSQGRPYRVADLTGAGHFAGATIGVSGASDFSFLEGDDTFTVDGRPAADFHGTGTDSFFNCGGYFASGPYAAATHACNVKVGAVPTRIGATRTFVTDVVPFDASFTFDLEHGNRNNKPGLHYESVAYWYQARKDVVTWPMPQLAGAKRAPR